MKWMKATRLSAQIRKMLALNSKLGGLQDVVTSEFCRYCGMEAKINFCHEPSKAELPKVAQIKGNRSPSHRSEASSKLSIELLWFKKGGMVFVTLQLTS